ncbi:hypothetical protein CN285_27320 [Bacillus cereus]|nr:hypothetical protein CN285_27320 [Bacillus cereus]
MDLGEYVVYPKQRNMIRNLVLESEFFPLEIGTNFIKIGNKIEEGTWVTEQGRVYWHEILL